MSKLRYLHLGNGQSIAGIGFGSEVPTAGEVVFTTAMTGYVESMTDPSFAGQILVFTYPLIGNYGVPVYKKLADQLSANWESERVWVRGVILCAEPSKPSHFQSSLTFSDWCKLQGVSGIYGVDTRQLTQQIRDFGQINGKMNDINHIGQGNLESDDLDKKMVEIVSTKKEICYESDRPNGKIVALIDCGVKHGIVRSLLANGFTVIRIPWNADPTQVGHIDGVVCSNGPGNPKYYPETVSYIKKCLRKNIPFLGICLGHQLLALALGADTYKLPFGHRGLNQPCQDLISKKAYVTSQNHGYAVDPKTLPTGVGEWFRNLNDGTNEGIISKKGNIFGVQFHPEGHPGPDDTKWIIADFVKQL